MAKFDLAYALSTPEFVAKMIQSLPNGANKIIAEKLEEQFSHRQKAVPYTNVRKLLLGTISTKKEQREFAVKIALELIEENNKQTNRLLSLVSSAA